MIWFCWSYRFSVGSPVFRSCDTLPFILQMIEISIQAKILIFNMAAQYRCRSSIIAAELTRMYDLSFFSSWHFLISLEYLPPLLAAEVEYAPYHRRKDKKYFDQSSRWRKLSQTDFGREVLTQFQNGVYNSEYLHNIDPYLLLWRKKAVALESKNHQIPVSHDKAFNLNNYEMSMKKVGTRN